MYLALLFLRSLAEEVLEGHFLLWDHHLTPQVKSRFLVNLSFDKKPHVGKSKMNEKYLYFIFVCFFLFMGGGNTKSATFMILHERNKVVQSKRTKIHTLR